MIDAAKIDTTIYIGGFAVHQPVTFFTDVIISVLCFFFFLKLNRIAKQDQSTIYWKRFFFFLCMASFVGGCSHGLFLIHEGFNYKTFWLTMQLLNVISVYWAQQATITSLLIDSPNKKILNIGYAIQLLLFSLSVFIFHNFLVVVIDSALGLIPIMILHFRNVQKNENNKFIAWGIVVLCLTAFINGTKISINEYFTYLDIAHVLIMINLSLMFVGVKRKAIA
jgi:hypothetical protein